MVGTRVLLRGHYNPTNWTRKYPNLQKTVTPKGEKVYACTTCIRTFSKPARLAKKKELKAAAAEAAKIAKAAAPVVVKKAEKPAKVKKEKKEAK
jgi:hypothetical protein